MRVQLETTKAKVEKLELENTALKESCYIMKDQEMEMKSHRQITIQHQLLKEEKVN
jgi:hypothetical protein